ncbi:hypothetical protein SAMN04489761_3466 [Tenacibaculum sp. MAR_2009_124]|uniref:hypothetical protein n=1 Tax=Tenacibaculum sp. MAR_2009_124 TaxID=1250059 RepID=UPI00089A169D|nr:hypothetical protein [Tenacibaculum sp. MAR_2009_124]SEC67328.1 hypothetical protein SAMN04489761_3466 [Tenacibaculum sp. MAR_2009_124]
MKNKRLRIEDLELSQSKIPENFYLEIELEDLGQDFLKLQLDKEGRVVGAQPFYSIFCSNLRIDITSIRFNWYPSFERSNHKGQLKYKVLNYSFLLPKQNDFLYNKKSAFIGSFERFEDVGICKDSKLNLDINDTNAVLDFCVDEATSWFDGMEDHTVENRLLFSKLLLDRLYKKYTQNDL